MVYQCNTLTQAEIHDMKEEIKSNTPPDVIAIVEIKPKNYTTELTKTEYNIEVYSLQPANLEDISSTRRVTFYIQKSLNFSRFDIKKIIDRYQSRCTERGNVYKAETSTE